MLTAARTAEEYVLRGRDAFDRDSAIRDAILYQIVVNGEAAKAVVAADATIADASPAIEWSLWARMRDRLTHQYWTTDPDIVWSTAANDVPDLSQELTTALERLKS